MAFTEFYCQTTGDNLNAGSTTSDAAAQTYAGGTFVRSTGVFTVASGNPSSDGVAVGDFASIYTTSGATVATCVGRVTARDTTTITISTTALSGATSAVSESAGATTCKVGGAWKGPNGTVAFPFNFVAAAMTNSSTDRPRVNFKSGTSYAVTAAMTHSLAGPVTWQGYTTTVADGGRAIIDGGTASAYTVLTMSGATNHLIDLIFTNDCASGSPTMLFYATGTATRLTRCVAHDCRAIGFYINASGPVLVECEAYGCNKGNSSTLGAFYSNGATFIRCIAHDNSTGSNCDGFFVGIASRLIQCISDTNAGKGFQISSASSELVACDAYNNTGDGIALTSAGDGTIQIESCNLVKNGGYGINGSGSGARIGYVINCGFGSGTQANTSGTTTGLKSIIESGSVTYTSNTAPWVDAPNGDFRINLAGAKGAGRGSFTQTAASYSGAVGYPDIGAVQHQDSGGAAGIMTHPGMLGGMRG